jgi:23S rRNA (uracil1939-C5)-methyltransferase
MKLRIEKAIYGGDGLARDAGKAVFIPGTLPGELVTATITTDKRSFASGRLESVEEASAQRIMPGCEYVPRCGGCQYQHADYEFQLHMKLDILRETMARAHVVTPDVIATLSGPALGYRNRIRLQVLPGGALGYRQRASHRVLPVTHCPIAAPLLEEAMAAVGRIDTLCEEAEFFSNGEKVLISLWPGLKQRVAPSAVEELAERVSAQFPALAGVGLFAGKMTHWGERFLRYPVAGFDYRVSLGSFFQVNRFLVPELVELVTKGFEGKLAWDLYAGVGLFARALTFENVTAVESEKSSGDDLVENLPGRHRVLRSGTLEFLATAQEKPELVVVDPPRAGLGKEVCAQLVRVGAERMVYVSCDPATLGRDLQFLLQNGYLMEGMTLVDLFPQTFHMETVVSLKRN